jgi:hypothetical protein
MSLDSLLYLLEMFWPYLAGAAAIGLVTGWVTYRVPGK